ncbi:helix-turn-helix transcriptional regulator [Kitasatospora sp. NPDC018058]|uniref:helix-turn-helix transcriptional regulator n=1 Tax=Kitasatospora sp. NPDC018058 TaxID=3364025 RepID=UPI0037BE80EC
MSTTPYGFDAAKLRAARTAAGASVARIAKAVGVTERAVNLYLAGTRVPKPELLPRLAKAVRAAPSHPRGRSPSRLAVAARSRAWSAGQVAGVAGVGKNEGERQAWLVARRDADGRAPRLEGPAVSVPCGATGAASRGRGRGGTGR